MRTRRNSLIAMLAPLVMFGCLVSAGVARAEDTRINVGFASAKPTDQIDIPITFSGPEGASANVLIARLAFPSNVLTFDVADRALASELADAEVKATTTPDKSDKNIGVLELNITGKSPIKPGIVAYVKFKVSKDATKGELKLDLLDSSAKGADGNPVQLAKGDSGSVTMFNADEEIPVVGCFFFTH